VAVLQDSQLLPKSQVLGSKALSSTRRRKQCADKDSKPFAHCRKASRKWWNKAIGSMWTDIQEGQATADSAEAFSFRRENSELGTPPIEVRH
jgi:hypothetical protein